MFGGFGDTTVNCFRCIESLKNIRNASGKSGLILTKGSFEVSANQAEQLDRWDFKAKITPVFLNSTSSCCPDAALWSVRSERFLIKRRHFSAIWLDNIKCDTQRTGPVRLQPVGPYTIYPTGLWRSRAEPVQYLRRKQWRRRWPLWPGVLVKWEM